MLSAMSAFPITYVAQSAAAGARTPIPCQALRDAAAAGDVETIAQRIAMGDDPGADQSAALRLAAANGHTEVVKLLIGHIAVNAGAMRSAALRWACAGGFKDIVVILLRDPNVNPNDDSFSGGALRLAAQGSHIEVLDLLLQDKRVSAGAGKSAALRTACQQGHAAVAARLLSLPAAAGIDPSACEFASLCEAATNGHAAIVAMLLDDGRSMDADALGRALKEASAAGHSAVVAALLRHEAAVASVTDNSLQVALCRAAAGGHTDTVSALLGHPRCGCCRLPLQLLEAMEQAAAGGHCATLTVLLEALTPAPAAAAPATEGGHAASGGHAGDSFEARASRALVAAATRGHLAVVQLLLADSDGRFPADHGDSIALVLAAGNLNVEVVKALLADASPRRADPDANRSAPLLAVISAVKEAAERARETTATATWAPASSHGVAAAMAAQPAGTAASAPSSARDLSLAAVVDRAVRIADALLRVGRGPRHRGGAVLINAASACGEAAPLVARLLQDERLDAASLGMEALAAAACHADATMLRCILACPRVIVGAAHSAVGAHPIYASVSGPQHVLDTAVANDAADCVAALLADGRFDPNGSAPAGAVAVSTETPLTLAIRLSHTAVVERLLADPRTRGDADDSAALLEAVRGSKLAAVDLLLDATGPHRADPAARRCAAVQEAMRSGFPRLVDRVLSDRRAIEGMATAGDAELAATALPTVLELAWRRRRHVVAARARALEED